MVLSEEKSNRVIKFSVWISVTIYGLLFFIFYTQSDPRTLVSGDAEGYYLPLRKWLCGVSEHDQESFHFIKQNEEGKSFNKFSYGTAALQIPFVLISKIISDVFSLEYQEGYSTVFLGGLSFAAFFYASLGLFFVYRTLETYLPNPAVSILLATFSVFFATNLLHYTLNEPAMSHVYSFFAISGFVYFSRLFFLEFERRHLIYAGLFLSIVLWIRLSNSIVLLSIPLLYTGSGKKRINASDLLYFGFFSSLGLLSQIICFKIQTGNFWENGYSDEGFYYFEPQWFSFLFSSFHGWLRYSPLWFLLLLPLFFFMRNKLLFLNFHAYFFFVIWFLSSWWNWSYPDGFGKRVMVDHYALMIIPVCLLIQYTYETKRKFIFPAFILFLSLTALLNIFQSWQMRVGLFSAGGVTNLQYKKLFFETDKTLARNFSLCHDVPFYAKEEYIKADSSVFIPIQKTQDNHSAGAKCIQLGKRMVFKVDAANEYAFTSGFPRPEFEKAFIRIIARYTFSRLPSPLLCLSVEKDGKTLYFTSCNFFEIPVSTKSEELQTEYQIAVKSNEIPFGSILKVFLWNKEKNEFLVSKWQVDLYITKN